MARDIEKVRAARRRWYERNAEHAKQQSIDGRKRQVDRNVVYVNDYKRDKSCMDCGGSFPFPVMEFDHREGEDKDRGISYLVRRPVGLARLQAEMDKCDLVCANCHRIRTARRGGWITD